MCCIKGSTLVSFHNKKTYDLIHFKKTISIILSFVGTMRTTSSLAKYILRSWQVFRLKIIILAPSQFPSGSCFDSLSRRRDRSGFSPDSNLRSVLTDHHEIMRFFSDSYCSFYYVIIVIYLSRFYRIFIEFHKFICFPDGSIR